MIKKDFPTTGTRYEVQVQVWKAVPRGKGLQRNFVALEHARDHMLGLFEKSKSNPDRTAENAILGIQGGCIKGPNWERPNGKERLEAYSAIREWLDNHIYGNADKTLSMLDDLIDDRISELEAAIN